MNSLGFAVLFVAVAAANAGLIAGHLGAVDSAAVISGPSGQIVRSGLGVAHAGPLAVAHAAPLAARLAAPLAVAHAAPLAVAHAAPLTVAHAAPLAVAHAAPVVSHRAAQLALELSVPAGSGLEGQWIPDINEQLYEDGSYKPYHYGL